MKFIAELMQSFFEHIFAYYDLLLHIGSDVITKRLQMWLKYPQCGHTEEEKFPIFGEITTKASPPIHALMIEHIKNYIRKFTFLQEFYFLY